MKAKYPSLLIPAALFVVVVGVIAVYFLFSDEIANYVWQRWSWGTVAVTLDRHDANLAMQIGMENFGQPGYDLSVALPAFEKAVAIQPGILWGHYEIARILFVDDNLSGALTQIDAELQYNPENLRSLYMRGLIEAYSGDWSDAETDLTRFTAWAPTEWAGYNDLGWVLSKEGKYAQAESVIDQAFASAHNASSTPWLWNTLGVAQLNQNEFPAALASFQKAQALAAKMTPDQWRTAYPGDAPSSDQGGLAAFQQAIAANIASAQAEISDTK